MTQQKPFRLGTKERWGATTCGFGVDREDCKQPATTHVMWLETSATSSTCEEHLGYIRDRADQPYETHTFGGDCGMPGSLWHHPYEDEDEGYCVFPAMDDASLLGEEPVPALTATDLATHGPRMSADEAKTRARATVRAAVVAARGEERA